jgi:hypothetical protein
MLSEPQMYFLFLGSASSRKSWRGAKFLVPDWGDIVDSGIGLSYRPARLHRLAGRYDKPMLELTISPQSGTKNFSSCSSLSIKQSK